MSMKRMTSAARTMLVAALLSLAAGSVARAAVPSVLEQVPADAKAILVINNVKKLSTKVSNAATRLNIPAPPDLAGYATRMAGITKGFDANGSAALVLVKPGKEPAENEMEMGPPPAVILLPTTDAKGMLEGMKPGEPDGAGISQVTLPGDSEEKGYVATVGGFVALAQNRDVLASYLAHKGSIAKTLSPQALKVFEANDIVIWASIPELSKGVDKWLEDRQQEFTGMLDLANLTNGGEPTVGMMQKEVVNQMFAGVKQYFKDADSAMVTIRLSDAGLTLGLAGSFKKDSPFANFVAAQKPTKPVSLEGLPGGDFLLAGTAGWDTASVSKLFADVSDQVLADEVVKKDAKFADVKKVVEQYRQLLGITSGMRMVLLEPAPGSKGKLMSNGAVIVETSDPGKYVGIDMDILKGPVGKGSLSMNGDIEQTATVTPDAVMIKGVKLSKVHMSWKLREETADKPIPEPSKQAFELITKMYGEDGVTAYVGVVGKRVVSVIGSEPATLEAAVAAAQANTNELASHPGVMVSKDQLVPNAVAVMYVPVSKWIDVVETVMMPGMGVPPPATKANGEGATTKPAVSPLVMSAGVSGNTLTMEMHVPISAIAAVKTAVQQAMMGGAEDHGMGGAEGGMEPEPAQPRK